MERVYGVMVTGQDALRCAFAEVAIKSFFDQTYQDKELIVINCGEGSLAREGVREIHAPEGLTLGELRNVALEVIPEGALWMVWDDDDWKHPELMAEQAAFIEGEQLDGCILQGLTYWSARDRFVVHASKNDLNFKVSTIMCRNRTDVEYPPLNCGEDGAYFKEYGKKYRLKVWDNVPHYHLKVIHDHNTSGVYTYIQRFILQGGWLIEKEARDYLSGIMPHYDFLKSQNQERS